MNLRKLSLVIIFLSLACVTKRSNLSLKEPGLDKSSKQLPKLDEINLADFGMIAPPKKVEADKLHVKQAHIELIYLGKTKLAQVSADAGPMTEFIKVRACQKADKRRCIDTLLSNGVKILPELPEGKLDIYLTPCVRQEIALTDKVCGQTKKLVFNQPINPDKEIVSLFKEFNAVEQQINNKAHQAHSIAQNYLQDNALNLVDNKSLQQFNGLLQGLVNLGPINMGGVLNSIEYSLFKSNLQSQSQTEQSRLQLADSQVSSDSLDQSEGTVLVSLGSSAMTTGLFVGSMGSAAYVGPAQIKKYLESSYKEYQELTKNIVEFDDAAFKKLDQNLWGSIYHQVYNEVTQGVTGDNARIIVEQIEQGIADEVGRQSHWLIERGLKSGGIPRVVAEGVQPELAKILPKQVAEEVVTGTRTSIVGGIDAINPKLQEIGGQSLRVGAVLLLAGIAAVIFGSESMNLSSDQQSKLHGVFLQLAELDKEVDQLNKQKQSKLAEIIYASWRQQEHH